MSQVGIKTPAADESGTDQPAKSKRVRPTKALPTDRINFGKQLDLLRAYAAVSGPSGKAVSIKAAADIVGLADSTASLANAFFLENGLLQRSEAGFAPAPEVQSFGRAYQWTPETASHKLAPLLGGSWFAQALMPKLEFGPLEEADAIACLADVASAAPEYKSQIRTVIDYLESTGLVQREGSMIRINRQVTADTKISYESREMASTKPAVTTSFAHQPEGVVQFHISVKVDMKELSGWQADRISAFFAGIAAVLAAKGAIEKEASG